MSSSKTVETKEIREGNTIRTIVTETVVTSSGQKRVSTRETVKTVSDHHIKTKGGSDDILDRFGKISLNNTKPTVQQHRQQAPQTTAQQAQPKQNPTQFIEDAVRAHNDYRRKHRVGDIKHNAELSRIAQSWAEHLAASGSFQHSSNSYKGSKLGENIGQKMSSSAADYTGKEAVDNWYNEVSKYDFNRATFTSGTGHFTQVVWKGSSELGMGKAKSKDGRKVYVVANYYPAGNMMGDFAQNVFPST